MTDKLDFCLSGIRPGSDALDLSYGRVNSLVPGILEDKIPRFL